MLLKFYICLTLWQFEVEMFFKNRSILCNQPPPSPSSTGLHGVRANKKLRLVKSVQCKTCSLQRYLFNQKWKHIKAKNTKGCWLNDSFSVSCLEYNNFSFIFLCLHLNIVMSHLWFFLKGISTFIASERNRSNFDLFQIYSKRKKEME